MVHLAYHLVAERHTLRGFGAAPVRALWFTSYLQIVVHPLGWELDGGWCLMALLRNFESQSVEFCILAWYTLRSTHDCEYRCQIYISCC